MKKQNSFISSLKYALTGIKTAFLNCRNLKIHFFMMVLVIFSGMIFRINKNEWIICLVLFALVISAEMFNTAIELTFDKISIEYDSLIKMGKDIAAAAVLVVAIFASIIGLLIFIPYLYSFLR